MREKVIAPSALRGQIIEKAHAIRHFETEKTEKLVTRNYFWLGMKKDINAHCECCKVCAKAKPNLRSKIPLVIIEQPAHSAGDNVAIDLARLPWSSDGYRYFLLVVNEFTKFVEIIPMRDQSAESVKEAFLEGWVYRH